MIFEGEFFVIHINDVACNHEMKVLIFTKTESSAAYAVSVLVSENMREYDSGSEVLKIITGIISEKI